MDNGSTDDSAAGLLAWNRQHGFFDREERLRHPHLANTEAFAWPAALLAGKNRLLLSAENLGFAAGNNLATRLALAQGEEDILLLNNDTTVAPDFLEELRAGMLRHPGSVLIPQIRLYHDRDSIWNCGGELQWPGRKKYNFAGVPVKEISGIAEFQVSFVTGCALLYRPQQTGLLTERFFFGEEDMEFSWRLQKLNVPAFCINTSVVYHKVGQTLSSNNRKSEIFTLKRLVNLRLNKGGLTMLAGYGFYLLNLLRLLIGRYGLPPATALARTYRVARRSYSAEEVGGELCVDYVQREAFLL